MSYHLGDFTDDDRIQLTSLKKTAEDELYWRKIATGAAIAGALFAAVRLTDIWLAVRRRKA
jgi:hypothetical protein